ncbi:Outer membrane usher protein PapC precursor [compost metagenome]
MLDAQDKTNIDFSQFSQSDYVMPDEYQLQVTVNGQGLGNERVIPFYLPEGIAAAEPGAVN